MSERTTKRANGVKPYKRKGRFAKEERQRRALERLDAAEQQLK